MTSPRLVDESDSSPAEATGGAGRVLFCGSRLWTDGEAIRLALNRLKPTLVIEGGADGADRLARYEAELRGIPVLTLRADWRRYGRAGGPIWNQRMLDQERPDLVVACHGDLAHSRSTAYIVRRARKVGIPVELIPGPRPGRQTFLCSEPHCGLAFQNERAYNQHLFNIHRIAPRA